MTKRCSGLLLAAVAVVLFGGSCAIQQGRSEKLREAIYYFNEGVRWGRIQDVLSRLDPEGQAHFVEMHRDFGKNLQVTNCEVVDTQMDLEQGKAKIGVKLTWYRLDEMVVKETILTQFWEERDHEWLMVTEEFQSGQAF